MSSVLYIVPSATSHRTAEENLGVGYLSAFLKSKGYGAKIIDAWLENIDDEKLFQRIDYYLSCGEKFLFVGISTYISNMIAVKRIITYVKEQSRLPIVAGGFGPSFFPNEFLDAGVDIISIGEGEICNYQLCEYFEGKIGINEVQSIAYRQNGVLVRNEQGCLVRDINRIPFPERSTMKIAIARRSAINILSARGCAGHCSFCSVIAFGKLKKGKTWRQRSIGNFIDEIEELNANGAELFKVIDDSFIEKPRDGTWCRKFADEIRRRGLHVRFRGSLTAEHVTDDIISPLKEAGFFSFACGIENFSQRVLNRYGKRATVKDNIHALDIFRKYGIRVQCGLILFDPYTEIEDLQINLKYIKEYSEILMKGIFSELYAAAGTQFTNKLLLDNETGLFRENENYKYIIRDECVRRVYWAIKKWQRLCSSIYDAVVDPLIAPKNISDNSTHLLYDIYEEMHLKDICIFEGVLDAVAKHLEIEYIDSEIERSAKFFEYIRQRTDRIYLTEHMVYDGEFNKYL